MFLNIWHFKSFKLHFFFLHLRLPKRKIHTILSKTWGLRRTVFLAWNDYFNFRFHGQHLVSFRNSHKFWSRFKFRSEKVQTVTILLQSSCCRCCLGHDDWEGLVCSLGAGNLGTFCDIATFAGGFVCRKIQEIAVYTNKRELQYID